jgi:VanZ family protein
MIEFKKLVPRWLPVLAWAAVIFAASSYPTARASSIHWQDFIIKKSAHMFVYFVLTILLYRALRLSGVGKKQAAWMSVIFAILYGASDEFHQSFTPGREPTLRDVIFDTIGSVIAIYSLWRLLPKAPKKLKKWAKSLQIRS